MRKAELDRARVGFDLAKKQFERIDRLLPSGGIAKQDWDIAENRMQLLSRETKAAEFALRMAEFDAEQARSSLIQGPEKGRPSEPVRILSPVDGYVLKVFEESARPVQAGTPLLEVGDPDDLEGETDLFSADAAGVVPGMDVSIEGWGGDRPLRGRVSAVERSGFTKVSALGVEEQRVKVRSTSSIRFPPAIVWETGSASWCGSWSGRTAGFSRCPSAPSSGGGRNGMSSPPGEERPGTGRWKRETATELWRKCSRDLMRVTW